MLKKLAFLLFLFLATIFILIFESKLFDQPKVVFVSLQEQIDYKNNQFMQNNNLMQYSAYLIIDSKNEAKIEAFIQFNHKYEKNFENKSDFICLMKFNDKIIELETVETPKFYWNDNKKFIFNYKHYNGSLINTTTGKIGIAVIRIKDFSKKLKFPSEDPVSGFVLPYSMIKYQTPKIIIPTLPRLKSMGLCVHYSYNVPNQLTNWLDLHLSFGVSHIILYDATVGKNLTKLIEEKGYSKEQVIIKEFNIQKDFLCRNETLNCNTSKCNDLLLKSCHQFYEHEFKEKYHWRNKHEQLTSNDCFTELSQIVEFIGYYDLDEIVFPRSELAFNRSAKHTCDQFSTICSQTPFNNFYSYLHSLIKAQQDDRDINQFGSISFAHAAYLIPNNIEKQLIFDLQTLIQRVDEDNNKTLKFPLSLYLSEPPFNKGHTFLIDKNDVNYSKELLASYQSLIPCAYHKYIKNLKSLDNTLLRHLYFLTEGNQRMGKEIHYYKNIKSIFTHYAMDHKQQTWSIRAPDLSGHILSHYREDVAPVYNGNFKNSIRKLNVDFEYVFYLLKNHSSFCSI